MIPERNSGEGALVAYNGAFNAFDGALNACYGTFNAYNGAFNAFDDEVLWDYIRAGFKQGPGGDLELAYSGDWDAAVYSSLPLVWPRLLRLKVPTLGIGGDSSDILSAAALRRWARLQPQAELHSIPGGHLFPLEQPDQTAALVLDFLGRQRH